MARGYTLTQTGAEVQEILDDVESKTVYEDATQQEHGLMSTSDKRKLDNDVPYEALSYEEIDRLINF